jgi:ABC-type nitrate/sulfonate/bicarbonate transport system permease component
MIRKLFFPFGEVNKKVRIGIVAFWSLLFFVLFELFHSKVIPAPSKIAGSLGKLLGSEGFYEDLVASLVTTLKAMFYSILVTVLVVYASTIQFFKPIAEFISKCRYLTLTGLVFVFTMISTNLAELKMYLLMFGIIPFFVTSFLSIVSSTPPEERWKGYVNKKGRWGTLWEVVIIGKLDMLFEVMRQNFAISWMMITMVEGFAMSEGGIGTLLIKSNKYLDLSPVFAMLIIVLVLGLIFDYALSQMRNILFPYLKTRK